MNIALVSGLIILILLVIMLIAGVPIAVALGISSVVAILPIMDLEVAVVTGAQRIFSGISMFSLLAIPFFILAGNIMNKGGIAVRLINLAKLITGFWDVKSGSITMGGHDLKDIPLTELYAQSPALARPLLPPWVPSSAPSKKKKAMTPTSPLPPTLPPPPPVC